MKGGLKQHVHEICASWEIKYKAIYINERQFNTIRQTDWLKQPLFTSGMGQPDV